MGPDTVNLSTRTSDRITGVFSLVPVVAATVAVLWLVPDTPLRHLDDPSYWGVVGYMVALGLVGIRRWRHPLHIFPEYRVMLGFLIAMPIIYLANWLRFGEGVVWLGLEVAGAAFYWGIAWLATARAAWWLPAGIGAHALWDFWHYDRLSYVPDWYALSCGIIDAAIALYVLGRLAAGRRPEGWDSSP